MKKNNYSATHTSYNIFNSKKKYISTRSAVDLNYERLLKSCDIGLSTVVVRKKLLKKFSKPFPNIKTKEDFVLWLKITKAGNDFYGINTTFTNWNNNPDSLSKSINQKIRDAFKVYFYYQKMNFIKAVYFTILLSINYLIKNYK